MIEIKNLFVKFDNKIVYQNFNISFDENSITAILGKSGSGKTTLFNVLNNTIDFEGELVNNHSQKSMVYSTPRLIPTMTIEENLKFILKNNNFYEELKEVDLFDSKDKYPDELSSGMAQRVSLIRAFLYPSKIMLMDEPFVNLDISLKYKLMDMFKNLWQKQKPTTLLISHDIDDALYLADRIVLINDSKIILDIKNDKTLETKNKLIDALMTI
ncbi:MAG: ABC transporter ATP-binding protein [Clostridia bacterium]|nr:ABC transporter ATP-binding protein [Clostridia bacterium]